MRNRIALGAVAAATLTVSITICVVAVTAGATPRTGDQEQPVVHATFVRDGAHTYRHHRAAHARLVAAARPTAGRARALIMRSSIAAWREAHLEPASPVQVVSHTTGTDSNTTNTPDWACIRVHESGDRYNTPAAPSGAYGFLFITWWSLGYGGLPYQAPPAVQSAAALRLYHMYGWQPWSTRFVCGL
jgi:hypothetical protein